MGQLDDLRQAGVLTSEITPPDVAQGRAAESAAFVQNFDYKVVEGQGLQRGGTEDKLRDRLTRETWAHLIKIGFRFATVVNCLSWPLDCRAGSSYIGPIPARDAKKGEMFRLFVLKEPRIDQRDMGDGKYVANAILPTEMADELKRKYEETGGVFWFEGTEPPADFEQQVKDAYDKMTAWFWKLYEAARNDWQRYNRDSRWISDRQRDAAKFLYETAHIPELPEWVSATKGEAGTKECPNCAEVIKRKAKQCRFCGAVLAPEGEGFSRPAGPPPPQQPASVEVQPSQVSTADSPDPLAAADAAEGVIDDKTILDMPDDQVPAQKPARPSRSKKGGDKETE